MADSPTRTGTLDLGLKGREITAARKELMVYMAHEDSPAGFAVFFHIMFGGPLHSAAVDWIEKAYQAHDEGRGLLQECHRESGKTTVFSKFFFAFRLGQEPHKTWAVIRVNDDKANETTSGVARIIESDPNWKKIFPSVVPDTDRGWGAKGYYLKRTDMLPSKWEEITTRTSDDPTFVGYGWGSGGVIGSRFSGGVIVDDIHNKENTESERMMKRVHEFVTETLEFCVMKGAWEIWNFTPWNPKDVYAYVKSTGEYLINKTPVMVAAQEGEEGAEYWPPMPLNRNFPEAGNIPLSGRWWKRYWPEMWPWKRIASKYRKAKALGFARMMMLDLEAAKGINLKAEWLHRYPADKIGASWPVYFGVDYASTRDKLRQKDHDYMTLSILKAIPGGGLVLVDGYRGKISKGEALQRVASYASIYPTLLQIGVEAIGKGEEFYSDLLLVNDAMGRPLPLAEIKSHGRASKGSRFEDYLAPRFQMARVWVSDASTPFIEAFIDEWLSWPNGANDDTLDGVYMGVKAGEGQLPMGAREIFASNDEEDDENPWTELIRSSYG